MNAALEAINVTRMPTVPTLLAPTAVPAKMGILAMDVRVQDRRILDVQEDMDECSCASHKCDVNSYCTNPFSSHSCSCKGVFTGDFRSCLGSWQ